MVVIYLSMHTEFCFFFSSRRRHTRYWRDWSSDVCSSDLQVLFHSPSGVLFTFPSRYWSAIGHQGVLSLGGWSPQIQSAFHGSGPTQERPRKSMVFRLRDGCPLWCAVHALRLHHGFVTSAGPCTDRTGRPTTPRTQRVHAYTYVVWAESPFARHYSGSLG